MCYPSCRYGLSEICGNRTDIFQNLKWIINPTMNLLFKQLRDTTVWKGAGTKFPVFYFITSQRYLSWCINIVTSDIIRDFWLFQVYFHRWIVKKTKHSNFNWIQIKCEKYVDFQKQWRITTCLTYLFTHSYRRR